MSDTTNSLNEKINELKSEPSVLDEIKEEAVKLGEQIKDTAEDAWEKVKAVDVKTEFNHLKAETSELIDDLSDKAKGLWNKITGDDDTKPTPQDGPVK